MADNPFAAALQGNGSPLLGWVPKRPLFTPNADFDQQDVIDFHDPKWFQGIRQATRPPLNGYPLESPPVVGQPAGQPRYDPSVSAGKYTPPKELARVEQQRKQLSDKQVAETAALYDPALSGGAQNSNFVGAEADMIRRHADLAQAENSPINDWPRVNEHRQALADLFKQHHGGLTRGEVVQGVGVPVEAPRPVGVPMTVYRAEPKTREFVFNGGSLAERIAAANAAGGTIGNSPQLADMISQQSVAQKAAADAALAEAEQTKGQAALTHANWEGSPENFRQQALAAAIQSGTALPSERLKAGLSTTDEALAGEYGTNKASTIGQAIQSLQAHGIKSINPGDPGWRALSFAHQNAMQNALAGKQPYYMSWNREDLPGLRTYLNAPGQLAGPPVPAVPEAAQAAVGANSGVLRNTAPIGALPGPVPSLGTLVTPKPGAEMNMFGIDPQSVGLPGTPEASTLKNMLGVGAWGPLFRRPGVKQKRQLAAQQPALPRLQ